MPSRCHKPARGANRADVATQRRPSKPLIRVRASDPPVKADKPIDAAVIASARSYCDTAAIFFPNGQPKGMWHDLDRFDCGAHWFAPCKVGARLIIQQPSREILHAATRWQIKHKGVSSILHISFELTPIGLTQRELSEKIVQSTLLRWRPSGEMYQIGRMIYFCAEYDGKMPARNASFYDDKMSKLDGTPNQPKLEIKFQNAKATQKVITLASDICHLDPRQLFDQQFRLVDFEAYMQRQIRAAIRQGASAERSRAAYQAFQNRVQLFHDQHPQITANLASINDRIVFGDRLEWNAKRREDHHEKIIK
jgi:hypothetical protein